MGKEASKMPVTSDEIRAAFLSFFESKEHKIIPSSSLIPQGDPTLLLTTAGMVQFKPYFLGIETPPNPRLASCQKCFRTTDIGSVGDPTHLTFFEMLGNFSIGDYFKKEAISWAWEFVTGHLKLPVERLWITIFLDDDEAFRYWREVGVREERIIRMGEETNFWGPAGDSGPCGPCSEIHFDLGEKVRCEKDVCVPGCDCGRYSEIWNLVFTQYNEDKNGKRTPLPMPNIDTGMGLERVTAIMQGKTSVYDTDFFAPLLTRISKLSGKKYGVDQETDHAMRVVAEHSRGIAFLIGDGVLPSNEGRGYVLRRLLRRAALFGRRLGLEKPFLTEIVGTTINQMGHVYPELKQRKDTIIKITEMEETRFGETLSTGLEVIDGLLDYREAHRVVIPELIGFLREFRATSSPENAGAILEQHGFVGGGETDGAIGAEISADRISQLTYDFLKEFEKKGGRLSKLAKDILAEIQQWGQSVSGREIFKLYDTFGFPVELTAEIASGRGFSVDMAGFETEMEKQRERARASHKFDITVTPGPTSVKVTTYPPTVRVGKESQLDITSTKFVGYKSLKRKTNILGILVKNSPVREVKQEQEANIILEDTPFYGEMGGQVGDTGEIWSSNGRFLVTNTVRNAAGVIFHQGRVTKGSLKVGDEVIADVDQERRRDIARNHTATHLLHMALRKVVGEHVQQRGSLVAPDRFSFDFSHLAALTGEEIHKVQRIVNEKVRQDLPVYAEELPYKQAIQEGVIALFDEKYGEIVRVLRVGKPPVSAELCGGTHVHATGEIGLFYITGEHSIGSGLRRIEAVTGRQAEAGVERYLSDLRSIAQAVGASLENVVEKVAVTISEHEAEHRRIESLERELAKIEAESLLNRAEVINGVKVLATRVSSRCPDVLREMSDLLRDRLGSSVIVLGTVFEDKPAFIATVTPDLVTKGYDAGKIVREVARVTGGGGGGKASLAQGSGKDKSKLGEALQLVQKLVEAKR